MGLRLSSFGILLALAACTPASSDAEEGMETGPCIDGGCFDGLSCLSDICVGDDATATGSSTSGATSSPTATSTATATTTSGPTTTSDPSAGPGSSTAPPDDDDTAGPSTGDTDSSGESSSSSGDPDSACTVWNQNCPDGQKCNPWADDGGDTYNAARCVDLVASPAGIGEPCSVQGAATSGEDDCELGAMCWAEDQKTGVGTCVELCSGSEASPDCNGNNRCSMFADGATPVCLEECDPIGQNCPGAEACYSFAGVIECAPDMSGAMGAYGDECSQSGTCDPGLSCTIGSDVIGCAGIACCSPFCELGTDTCPAGTTCGALLGPEDALIFAALGWCIAD